MPMENFRLQFDEEQRQRFNQVFSKQVQLELEKISKGYLTQFAESWKIPFSDQFDEIRKSEEAYAKLLAPFLEKSALWLTPSMPYTLWQNLKMPRSQEIEPKQIEKIFIDCFEENNWAVLIQIIAKWFENKIFANRSQIIQDALEAHISGKYTLSIPTLLPQVEGILSSIIGKSAGKLINLLKEAFGKVEPDFLSSVAEDMLLKLAKSPFLLHGIEPSYFSPEKYSEWLDKRGILEENTLNRHAILHGIQINYATKLNSLRTFLLLDSLFWFIKIQNNRQK